MTTPTALQLAEQVRAAVIAKYPAWCYRLGSDLGKLDEDDLEPERHLPQLVQYYDWSGQVPPAPFAILWEGGPYEWALAGLDAPAVDAELTAEAQVDMPGAVIRSRAVPVPEGVRLEAIYSYALGIWPDEDTAAAPEVRHLTPVGVEGAFRALNVATDGRDFAAAARSVCRHIARHAPDAECREVRDLASALARFDVYVPGLGYDETAARVLRLAESD